MDIAVSDLRAHLGDWIDRARTGDEVVVTVRGVPVARLVGLETAPIIERLTAQGVIGRPRLPRPRATGQARTRVKGSIADLVGEQRR